MLGLGLEIQRRKLTGAGQLPSQVLYERDGSVSPFNVSDTLALSGGATRGTFLHNTDSFAGASSFMKFTVTTSDPDPFFIIPQGLMSTPLSTFYNARDEGGSLKISITHGFPSTNTDTVNANRIRIFAGPSINSAQVGPSKDALHTRSLTRTWSTLPDPDGDTDFLKVEFEDVETGEPDVDDVMYVQKIKVEYIAA